MKNIFKLFYFFIILYSANVYSHYAHIEDINKCKNGEPFTTYRKNYTIKKKVEDVNGETIITYEKIVDQTLLEIPREKNCKILKIVNNKLVVDSALEESFEQANLQQEINRKNNIKKYNDALKKLEQVEINEVTTLEELKKYLKTLIEIQKLKIKLKKR